MLDQPTYGPNLLERLLAALRLDLRLYEQVSADAAATGQAFRVVLLAGVANGLGLVRRLGGAGVAAGVGAAILGWFLWAAVILLVARLGARRRDERSLLRALGFANAPGVLLILGIVPVLGAVVRLMVVVWLVATTALAVEAVFDVTRQRAVFISVASFVVYLFLGAVSAYFAAG